MIQYKDNNYYSKSNNDEAQFGLRKTIHDFFISRTHPLVKSLYVGPRPTPRAESQFLYPRLRMVCSRWGQWIEPVASMIFPTKKKLKFVITLSQQE